MTLETPEQDTAPTAPTTNGNQRLIVAIDGPSGVGKTTVAKKVAESLSVPYLETGAMYRAAAVEALERGLEPSDREAIEEMVAELPLELRQDTAGALEIFLRGKPLGGQIRGLKVAQATSEISTYSPVRERMVLLQRDAAQRHGGVLEGRDIGTKVFPDTPHKFFLDAAAEVRSARRWRQLRERGRAHLSLEQVQAEVAERDDRDRNRTDSPLSCDDSYTLIDTGERTIEEVVELIVSQVGSSTDAT